MQKLLLCLSALLLFAGCSSQPKEAKPDIKENDTLKENEPAEKIAKVYESRPYAFTVTTLQSEMCGTELENETFKQLCQNGCALVDIPYINIDTQEISDLNQKMEAELSIEIQLSTLNDLAGDREPAIFVSRSLYRENGDFLSVIVLSAYYKENGEIEKKFNTFNIDLYSGKLLDDQEVLDLYMLDEESIETSLFNQLQAKGLGVCDDKQENCYAEDLSAADLVYYIDEKKNLCFYSEKIFENVGFGYPHMYPYIFYQYQ